MIEKDSRGRFAKKNRGGPGYPAGRRRDELQAAMLKAVTPEQINRITCRLVGMAVGDIPVEDADSLRAMKIVLDKVLPPQEKVLKVKGKVSHEHSDVRPVLAMIQGDPEARAAAMAFRSRLRTISDSN